MRLLICIYQMAPLFCLDSYRADFSCQLAILCGGLSPSKRAQGKIILCLARKLVMFGAILGKAAHQLALVIGIFQTIKKHMVGQFLMADTRTAPHLCCQIWRVGHTFHAACNDHFCCTCLYLIIAQHYRFHARATHFIHRSSRYRFRQAAGKAGLACRGLTQTCGQHASHNNLVNQRFIRCLAVKDCGNGRPSNFRGAHSA